MSRELGVPVVSSVAVRRGGIDALAGRDRPRGSASLPAAGAAAWRAPDAGELRGGQREADRLLRAVVRRSRRARSPARRGVDAVLLHPVAGLVVLLAILFVMFQAVFAWATPRHGCDRGGLPLAGRRWSARLPLPDLLKSFLKDGLIAGVGSVIVFLPQIVILFFFILVLEDLGYMARAAFLMDRIMGGAGLHGRAFIPLLSSFACAIPGIMATRVIDDRRDRLTTILVAPLMTCSARIPVYTLIIGAFIPDREVWGFVGLQGLVMFGLYADGHRRRARRVVRAEAPDLARHAGRALHARAARLQDAAGQEPRHRPVDARRDLPQARRHHHPRHDGPDLGAGHLPAAARGRDRARHQLQPGRHDRLGDPAAHRAARLQLADQRGADPRHGGARGRGRRRSAPSTPSAAARRRPTRSARRCAGQWSLATALALLAWYVFAPQCASTLAVIRRETGGWKWMWVTFFYMLALAYVAALITYQIARALGAG